MALVVQKYGGSSVATVERIKAVAERVQRYWKAGDRTVVVVSAMGDTTDHLLDLAAKITSRPSLRELDQLLATGEEQSVALLAMALHELQVPAVSLSGAQAGIRTIGQYGKARISRIIPTRMLSLLESGKVVIVAGFQGINRLADVTTLGRGGSDTTAVALAAALKADRCEIYTDVDGVYTADPRIVPEARKLDRISYADMAELAWRGAKVMHPRAIELGQLYGVEIVVRSSFNETPGTLITRGGAMENVQVISGLAHDTDVARVTLVDAPAQTKTLAGVFGPLAEAGISVDVIVFENVRANGRGDISFTVSQKESDQVESLLRPLLEKLGASDIVTQRDLAKVSIVGTGMLNRPGYAARMFKTLSDARIEVQMVSTSEIQVTCVIARSEAEEALRRLHRAFNLDRPDGREES